MSANINTFGDDLISEMADFIFFENCHLIFWVLERRPHWISLFQNYIILFAGMDDFSIWIQSFCVSLLSFEKKEYVGVLVGVAWWYWNILQWIVKVYFFGRKVNKNVLPWARHELLSFKYWNVVFYDLSSYIFISISIYLSILSIYINIYIYVYIYIYIFNVYVYATWYMYFILWG